MIGFRVREGRLLGSKTCCFGSSSSITDCKRVRAAPTHQTDSSLALSPHRLVAGGAGAAAVPVCECGRASRWTASPAVRVRCGGPVCPGSLALQHPCAGLNPGVRLNTGAGKGNVWVQGCVHSMMQCSGDELESMSGCCQRGAQKEV